MRRVVVTGMGIVSSIGNNTQEALASLHSARSGITRAEKYAELGFRCQVHGAPTLKPEDILDRRAMRFHGGGTAWCHVAMDQAILDAGLAPEEVSNERTGIIMGSGGPSTRAIVEAADMTRAKGPKRVGPYAVPKSMCSTASATLSTWFKIKGMSYSISSACATSNHCIGAAYEQIQLGKQDVMFAGGCEELDWTLSVLFDAMGAMSSQYNETPATGFPRLRQEPRRLRHFRRRRRAGARGARARQGARGENLRRDRRLWRDLRRRRHGGALRAKARRAACASRSPPSSRRSTTSIRTPPRRRSATSRRSRRCAKFSGRATSARRFRRPSRLTGHSQGATGVHEAIYSLLMMQNGFICESANIEELDPAFADMPIVRKRIDNVKLGAVLSNSFGFGGTNATLVFKHVDA